jgi:hypothetical protein
LGFLVVMVVFLRMLMVQKIVQQRAPLRPVAQTGVGVDVARFAAIHPLRAQGVGKTLRTREAAIRIVMAAQQTAGKRQMRQHQRRPAVQDRRQLGLLRIAGRDQQCAAHAVAKTGLRRPGRHQVAAHAVGHQHHLFSLRLDHLFKAHHPVTAQRMHPIVLLHPQVAVKRFPTALPMLRAGVLPAGQQQDARR